MPWSLQRAQLESTLGYRWGTSSPQLPPARVTLYIRCRDCPRRVAHLGLDACAQRGSGGDACEVPRLVFRVEEEVEARDPLAPLRETRGTGVGFWSGVESGFGFGRRIYIVRDASSSELKRRLRRENHLLRCGKQGAQESDSGLELSPGLGLGVVYI